MAGESPGRSEQRKSSGATAEAEAGRDPRLAVFGTRPGGAEAGAGGRDGADGADGADSPEGAGGGGGGDGAEVPAAGGAAAKAVPSQGGAPGGAGPEDAAAEDEAPGDEAADGETPDGEAADGATDEGASPKAERESDGAGTGAAGNARETAEQGDERLREAVAAWVATSDGERPAEDTAQDTAGDTAPEGKAGAPAGPAADAVEEDAAGRADLVTAAFGGLRAARAESSDRGGPSGAGASAEGGGDRGTMVFGRPLPDDEEREATGPSGPSTGEAADDAGTVTGTDTEERPDPDGTTEDRDGSEPLAKAKTKAAATSAAPEGGDAEPPAGSAQDGKPSGDAKKARPGKGGGTTASPSAESPSVEGPSTESPSTESPKKPESTGSAPSTEKTGKTGKTGKTETAGKTEKTENTPDHGGADAGGGTAGAATDSGGSGGKPVDQPTAVFRVRKPGKPDGSGPAGGTAEPGADGPGDGDTEPAAGEADRKGTAGVAAKPVADKAAGGRPEAGKAGEGKPNEGEPGSAKPEAATPGTAKSEPGKPESGKPDDAKPEPGEPESGKAGSARPESGKPGSAEPAAGRTSTFVPLQSADSAPRTPAPSKAPSSGPSWAARPDAAPADSASGSDASRASGARAGAGAAATAAPEAAPAGESEAERTKQQPLPPLDLLAKLTNTPPPPETPLRTLVRRVKIWTPLVLLLLIVFAIAQSIRPLPEPELRLTAASEYAFKGEKPSLPWPDEGQAYVEIDGLGSLGSSGEEKPVPIASVAKVMTAYVFLREHPVKKGDEGVKMKVDAQAVEDYETGKADSESVVRLTEGQMLSEYEALEALMLPSANNVARLMARWYEKENGGKFVAAMNDAAKDLGMKNTTFTDPSGLEKSTVSTAKDLVKLGKAAMAIPVFKEISAKPFYIDSNDDKQLNYNRLIPYTGIGIKTGTSTAAGGNLLFAAEQEIAGTKQLIVGAALGQYKVPAIDSVTEVSKQLIESAQAVLTDAKVVEKGQVVGHVDDGLGGTVPVVATEDVTAVGWPGLTVELALSDGGKTVPHEAEAGTEVGLLTAGSGPGQVKVPVALEKVKEEPGFGSKLTRIL